MSRSRKNRKNKNKKVNRPSKVWGLIEEKNISITNEYNQFKNRMITELDVREYEYTDFEEGVSETTCERMRVVQSITSPKIVFDTEKYRIIFTPIVDGVYLHILEVYERFRRDGIGKEVMRTVQRVSDELNIPVYLIPIVMDENVEYEVLKKFYKSFGYNREKTSRYWKYEPNSVESDSLSFGMVS